MSEEKFDCIIVGGGLSGLTAAYLLAEKGLETLLIEKGNYSGAKNMTGGRLYGHSLEKIIPAFAQAAPVERRIVKERLSYQDSGKMTTVEYDSRGVAAPEGESYSVLRGKFDKWLADQAEEKGAMLVCGVRVDDLIVRDGKVCGVIAGDEEMEADVVILADGANSLLGQKLGFKHKISTNQVMVGVKELLELDKDVINQRFGIESGEGVAWMFSGCSDVYDGFLYTNSDSVSVGVTMMVENIKKTDNSVPQMLEDFKNNTDIAPLIEGSRLIEYSAHLIPEGGPEMIPKLYGDGVLITGDAAALCANLGFTIRGMDLSIESGRLAAEAVLAAKEKEEFSTNALSYYQTSLENNFVMSCVKGSEVCLAAVKSGDLKGDPLKVFNNLIKETLIG